MTHRRFRIPLSTLALAALLPLSAQAAPPDTDRGTRCKNAGGASELWSFYAGTNGAASNWVLYGSDQVRFCTFTSATGTRITVSNNVMVSTKPTLAALSYYYRQPFDATGVPPGVNAASYYCKQVGGTDYSMLGGNGMGWAPSATESAQVTTMCMFADGSMVDSWGLAYYAYGVVRGIDLGTVIGFKNPY